MFKNNKIKTKSSPTSAGYGLAIPSCQAFVDSGNYNDHRRYGLGIPSGQQVKRKLFAEDYPTTASNTFDIPSDFNSRNRYLQGHSTNQNNDQYEPTYIPQQQAAQPLYEYPKRIVLGDGISQIAIRKKHNDSPTGWNNEVFLLNGNWDTSHSIPNIVAEMHNVNLAELQCTWGSDDGDPITATCGNGGQMTSILTANDSRDSKNSSDNVQIIHQQRIDNISHRGTGALTSSSSEANDTNQDFNGDDNFQWLVNFKLDDLIHASTPTSSSSDYTNTTNSSRSQQSMIMQTNTTNTIRSINMNPNYSQHVYIADMNSLSNQYFTENELKNIIQENRTNHIQSRQLSTQQQIQQPPTVAVKSLKHMPVSSGTTNMNGNNQGNHPSRYSGPRKPPFTYTELIEHALREKGELTVSGIYQWISDHFPFYKANDDRWKNSVRHNLSINPHFRKGSKAVHGAGHLWTIAQRDDKRMSTWIMKKQRMQQFMEKYDEKEKAMEDELQAATASILPEMDCAYLQNELPIQNTHQRMGNNVIRDDSNNVKHEVEVQYLIPVSDSMDFMCPVSKEQVAEECGLQQSCNSNDDNRTEQQRVNELTSGDYLITDLNPQTLGLNLSEAEIITPDQLFGDDLNFQCYELQV